ncbi:hypothetical protein E2542_SST11166 [Spatholobus suberectus]|nr:hypothetical protein E2542_SST11166 [Spatholobus suberectus]
MVYKGKVVQKRVNSDSLAAAIGIQILSFFRLVILANSNTHLLVSNSHSFTKFPKSRNIARGAGRYRRLGTGITRTELPITQYFESARQAGLVRYSSSSGETDPYARPDRDLYCR